MSWSRRLKRTLFGEEPAPGGQAAGTPAREGASAAADGGSVLATLRQEIARFSEGRLAAEEIDPGVSLFDHGYIDSLSAVNLLAFVQETYGVAIPDVELVGQLGTLRALADHIARERRPEPA